MIERIIYNGNIITLDEHQRRVTAVAITNGHIVAAGTDDEIKELAPSSTPRQNLEGATVIPGMTDAHLHWEWTARALQEVDVFSVPDKHVALERVAERVHTVPDGDWVCGHGWSQSMWPGGTFPTAADLDAVAPHNPVYLRAKSGHAVWVNSVVLQQAGITADTPDPEGGQIARDESGNPTGILFEDAIDLAARHVPTPTTNQLAQLMKQAQKLALSAGLTGFHDFDGPECLRALQILREQDELALRVVKNVNDVWIHHMESLGLRWGFGDDWIRLGGLKIFADGALGSVTALMVDAYEGQPDNFGIVVTEKEDMLEHVSRASANGIPSTIHAIGDRAVHDVLDVYAVVRKQEAERGEPRSSRRHRIEHVQIVHPDDIDRLAQLDIVASMQPIHATSDYEMADLYWGTRSNLAYNPRVQIDRGVTVAFGSDSPVDPFEPLGGIFAAVTRRRPDGTPGPNGWYPETRLSVEEALRGFTIGPAYAAGMEKRLGKLTPGFLADLVVLDRDLYHIPHDEILDVQIVATMVGGEWRYGGL